MTYRRMLDEADPEDREYVEAVIAHISWTFSQPDDDPGLGGTGVREPRRPAPQAGSAVAALDLPGRYDESA